MQTKLATHLVLRPNISARRWIIADENNRNSRRNGVGFQVGELAPKIDITFFGNRPAVDQISHFTNLNESTALNQRQHRTLESQSFFFEFFRGRCWFDLLRQADNDSHFRKRLWNDEPVPTFHPPATRIFHVDRNDRGSGFLREKDNARSELISGTARTIRRQKNVATGRKDFAQLEKGAGAHS